MFWIGFLSFKSLLTYCAEEDQRFEFMERVLVADVAARGRGTRHSTLDVIGVGPRYVAGYLRKLGFEAEVYPFEKIVREPSILRGFDVLAVSAMITDVEAASRVIELWRRFRGRAPVIVGGPIALSREALRRLDFDLAFLGECEIPLMNLVRKCGSLTAAINDGVANLEGVYVKGSDNFSLAPWAPREVINSVDYDTSCITRYDFWWACRVYVEVVRGCSNFGRPAVTIDGRKCIGCNRCREGSLSERLHCPAGIPPGCGYCSVPYIHGPPRSRDVDKVVREIRDLLERGVRRIVLSAPDFLDYGRDLVVSPEPLTDPRDPPPNIDAIEKLLSRVSSLDLVAEGKAVVMIENIKPCLVNEYVAEVLGRYLRGTPVFIGVESASNELLRRIGRPCSFEECLRAIKLLRKHGLRPYVYLLHGLPLEREDDLLRTARSIKIMEDAGVEHIVLYRFTPLPLTAFERAPRPPPAVMRRGARELYLEVKKFNRKRKRELLGKVLKLVVASRYRKKGYLVAYPLTHGPTTLLKGEPTLIGCIVEARIVRVLSERLVEGDVIAIIERAATTRR